MKDKKKQLLETIEKSARDALDALYARSSRGKIEDGKRKGYDPIDDVLDNNFKPESDSAKIAPVKTGIMNKNNQLESHKNKKNKYKLRAFLENRKNKKKAK